MASNNAPKINPLGTVWTDIKMYTKSGEHTRVFKTVLKHVGEYVRADYVVTMTTDTSWHHTATIKCIPPLLDMMETPQ